MDLFKSLDETKAVVQHAAMVVSSFNQWHQTLKPGQLDELESQDNEFSALIEDLVMLESEVLRIAQDQEV